MRSIRLLKLMFPLMVLAASLAGVLAPRPAEAAFVCNYYCLNQAATCCITCHWFNGSCVCPDTCTIGPNPDID